jgi:hypothetical protein
MVEGGLVDPPAFLAEETKGQRKLRGSLGGCCSTLVGSCIIDQLTGLLGRPGGIEKATNGTTVHGLLPYIAYSVASQ